MSAPRRPVVYVREQEGTEIEIFATVEEAMDGGYDFSDRDHLAAAGDPWHAEDLDEHGVASSWSACPKGEPAVYIFEIEIPSGCLPDTQDSDRGLEEFPERRIAGEDDLRGRLIEEIGKGRQGVVTGRGWTGDLIGSLQDPDHAKADLAERRMSQGVSVVPIADVEAAIDRVLPASGSTDAEEGKP